MPLENIIGAMDKDKKLEELEKNIIEYINPLNDWAFKYLFGRKELMIDLLNDITHYKNPKAPKIIDIIYLNTNKLGSNVEVPGIIYDIRCKTDRDNEFIVEMQKKSQPFFQKRVDFYMSKAVVSQEQSPISEWRYNFNPVFGVFFMNFYDKIEPQTPIIHCSWKSDGRSPKVHSDNMQYWKIQLPHFRHKKLEDCKTNLDYWLYIIANMETIKGTLPFTDKKPIFKQLEQLAEYANLHQDDKWAYWQAQDQIACTEGAMEMRYEEGVEVGLMKGRAEERKKAHEKDLRLAYKLFLSGMDLDQVAQTMELSLDELSNYIIDNQKSKEE